MHVSDQFCMLNFGSFLPRRVGRMTDLGHLPHPRNLVWNRLLLYDRRMLDDAERARLRIDLPVAPDRVFLTLFGIEVAILLVDLVVFFTVEHRDLRRLFDLNLEANLPTAFAVLQALAVALAALLIAVHGRKPAARSARHYGWLAIAAFFAFVALDDAAQIHERVATAWSDMVKSGDDTSMTRDAVEAFGSYYWQLLILPLFVAAGIAMAVFVKRELGSWTVAWLFFAGLGFYANAVVLDYFDAWRELYQLVGGLLDIEPATAKHLARNVEELIEMFGTTCILVTFLRHLARLQISAE